MRKCEVWRHDMCRCGSVSHVLFACEEVGWVRNVYQWCMCVCVCTLLLDIFLLKDDMAIVNDMLKTRQELCVAGRGDLGTLTTQEVLKLFTLDEA